jgi:DNA adenine methylase
MDRQPIKRHGGKSYQAKQIVALMPPRVKNPNKPAADDLGWLHYVEPYFGGGAVLFKNDPTGISEVVNDLDGELTNFWRVLQDPGDFEKFRRIVQAVPCSQVEYNAAHNGGATFGNDRTGRAVAFFVRNRQSRQALDKGFATITRNRTRRGMNELPSAWLSAIDGLQDVHRRLQRVVILNEPALKVIRQQDGPRTLFYFDPTYLHETRTVTDAYRFEMSEADHVELLELLATIKGRFLLSGYRSDLYDRYAEQHGWRRADFDIDNKAGSGKEKRKMVESIWMNY